MEKDDKILDYISRKQSVSQRELAAHTGLSLGNVNLIIQRMINKGFIKMERIRPGILLYILTPKGLLERARRAYQYILSSVRHVLLLKREMTAVVEQYSQMGYSVCLFGDQDEIYDILKHLTTEGILRRIRWISQAEDLASIPEGEKVLVLVWQAGKEAELHSLGIESVNLLDRNIWM